MEIAPLLSKLHSNRFVLIRFKQKLYLFCNGYASLASGVNYRLYVLKYTEGTHVQTASMRKKHEFLIII